MKTKFIFNPTTGEFDKVTKQLNASEILTSTLTKTANYTILAADNIIFVDSSGGAFDLTLPVPTALAGRIFRVIDKAGFLNTNNVTLIPSSTEKIEGLAANKLLQTAWGWFNITTDGVDWYIG